MADTKRALSALQTLLADNSTQQITAQRVRDFLISVYGVLRSKTIALIDTPYNATADDDAVYADATSGGIVVNLLETGADDKLVLVAKTDASANTVTINRSGSDTINGGTSLVLTRQRGLVLLHKQGTDWIIVGDQRSDKTHQAQRINQLLSTGLINGGTLSITDGEPAKFDIAEGSGIVIDLADPKNPVEALVEWATKTAQTLPDISTSDATYIGIDSAGSVVKSSAMFTPAQLRTYIFLGALIHSSRTQIDAVSNAPRVMYNVMSQLNDFVSAVGTLNIEGNIYSANGANLKINKGAGKTFALGTGIGDDIDVPNIHTDSVDSDVQPLVYMYRSATPDVWTISVKTAIDPEYYDDGSGTLVAATGKWTIQTIYFSCLPVATYIQYGQAIYDTKEAALAAITTAIQTNPVLTQATFRCWLIVKQGKTVLNDSDTAFVSAGKFGNVSAMGAGAGGEINTASNQGNAGYGPYYQKLGVDLQFKNIAANSTKIAVTDDTVGHNIKIDVAPGNIAHQDLSGAGTNAHSAIDGHIASTSNPHSTTKAQVGLTNVTDDAQLKRAAADINSFTEKTAPVANDLLLIEDSADSNNKKKLKISNIPGVKTKRLFFILDYTADNGNYRIKPLGTGGNMDASFYIPGDFLALTSLKLVGINRTATAGTVNFGTAAGTIGLYSSYAKAGEISTQIQENPGSGSFTMPAAGYMVEYSIASVFSSLAAGHICGINIDHNTIGGYIDYIGIELVYTTM